MEAMFDFFGNLFEAGGLLLLHGCAGCFSVILALFCSIVIAGLFPPELSLVAWAFLCLLFYYSWVRWWHRGD